MKVFALLFLFAGAQALVGSSGIVSRDGKNVQFTADFARNIVLVGPSGIVTRDGKNLQLTQNQVSPGGPVPVVPVPQFVAQRGLFGPSGIVSPTGRNIQFTQGQVDNFVLRGPSGIVTKDGNNIQFTDDLQFVNRKKRSIGFVSEAGNIGTSGILRKDGTTDLFDHDTAHNIILIGPSGIVTKDGHNLQLTRDLQIVGRAPGAAPVARSNILLEGPSGIILADGTLIQKTA